MKSWKTTLAAVVVFVATSGEAAGLPEKWVHVAQGLAIAVGLGVAKDHNVTGGSGGGWESATVDNSHAPTV